jgi:hypothetical protein
MGEGGTIAAEGIRKPRYYRDRINIVQQGTTAGVGIAERWEGGSNIDMIEARCGICI